MFPWCALMSVYPVQASAQAKWRLYYGLADWRFLLRVAENIFDRESSDSYASACADLFLEVCARMLFSGNHLRSQCPPNPRTNVVQCIYISRARIRIPKYELKRSFSPRSDRRLVPFSDKA